jgi:hypothetical protein
VFSFLSQCLGFSFIDDDDDDDDMRLLILRSEVGRKTRVRTANEKRMAVLIE